MSTGEFNKNRRIKRIQKIVKESKPIFWGNKENSEEVDRAVNNAIFETKAAISRNIEAVENGEKELAYNKDIIEKI